MDKRISLWRSPGFLFQTIGSPILFVLSIGLLIYVVRGWTGGDEAKAEDVAVAEPVEASQTAPVLVNPPPPGFPVAAPSVPMAVDPEPVAAAAPSSIWRVAGYIRRGDQKSHPDDPSGWSSRLGYGDRPDRVKLGRTDQAILVSMSGVRYVPLTECQAYPDGFNYSCDVDGERVTPWSGRMGLTDTIPGSAVSGAREAASEQREKAAPAVPEPVRHAELPVSQVRVTVVPDTSRNDPPWSN